MAKQKTEDPFSQMRESQDKEETKGFYVESDEAPLPLTVTSRVLYMLGDIAAGPAYRFTQWLDLVRKRSARYGSSGFPHRPNRMDDMLTSFDSSSTLPCKQASEINLWERLGKAAMLDIESSSFSWELLSSLHHTEHSNSTDQSEDESSKPLEVTVNSGGVVFFALFNHPGTDNSNESAAVIKFSSSRMASQSERLGYEFAKWLGVRTPQVRVVHNSNPEWVLIKEAAERARAKAVSEGDEVVEMTCSELLEALDLSRCLLLMSYVHGCPLLESANDFESDEKSEKVASALGRVLLLDLVIRNEDRLPCRQLRWRGNPANLLLAEKMSFSTTNMDYSFEEAFDSAIKRCHPRVLRAIQKERRSTSVDSRLNTCNQSLISQLSDLSDITESPKSSETGLLSPSSETSMFSDFHVVAIDSVVPRWPPAGKRAIDHENYPKLVELLLNSSEFSSDLLQEITGGKLAAPTLKNGDAFEVTTVNKKFRNGFRAAIRDLQAFHIFLAALHQKVDSLLKAFSSMMDETMSADFDKEELPILELPSRTAGFDSSHCSSPLIKERVYKDSSYDHSDSVQHRAVYRSLSFSECRESCSPSSRESSHGKLNKVYGESLSSQRLAAKLRDFHKLTKVDVESNKELEQWNETLRNEVYKLCSENNFNTGFFEGGDSNIWTDAYELKVRLEHILERISLLSKAANTEKPSLISHSLFIGGGLAARSVFTLQHLGVTHILCLCANEVGQSDTQYPDLFEYKNISIIDDEDANIESIFEDALNFIDHGEQTGGKVLVHCFEGRSRSSTVILAYLMLRKNFTLSQAWNSLKKAHRRAQPNDGFARILVDLDKKLHGKVSMEWRQRKPSMKVCPICGKNAGLSSSSLKIHLQQSHKRLSSGSVDSAMTMEIQKALDALSRESSVSPKTKQSHSKQRSPI